MKNKLFHLYISLCVLVIIIFSFDMVNFILFIFNFLFILGLTLCVAIALLEAILLSIFVLYYTSNFIYKKIKILINDKRK